MTRFPLPVAWLTLALIIGCAAPPLPADPASRSQSTARPGQVKRLVAAVAGELNGLNYQVSNATGTVVIVGIRETESLVNVGLTVEDDRGGRQAVPAEAVPTVENGGWQLFPDSRMETTWTIRPGARWHDGAPVTVADLLFTARLSQDRDLAVFEVAAYEAVEAFDPLDERTIRARWKRPFIYADWLFSHEVGVPVPSHVLEKPYAEDRAGFLDLPYWSQEFIGNGPYRLREFARGSHILLVANDEYMLGRPRIDEIEVRFIADPNALVANLLAGAVDVTLNARLSLEQGIHIRDQWREGAMDLLFAGWIVYFPSSSTPLRPRWATSAFDGRWCTASIGRRWPTPCRPGSSPWPTAT